MTTAALRDDDADDARFIVAISTDDSFLHVASPADLLTHMHNEHGAAPDPHHRPDDRVLEFFDLAGHRLRPLLDPNLQVTGFDPVPDDVVLADELLSRIDAALDVAQARLDADPDLGNQHPLPPATHVPRPAGTLREVVETLAQEFDILPGPGHRAGWFHNLFHV